MGQEFLCMPENIFSLLLHLIDSLSGYRILDWKWFFLQNFEGIVLLYSSFQSFCSCVFPFLFPSFYISIVVLFWKPWKSSLFLAFCKSTVVHLWHGSFIIHCAEHSVNSLNLQVWVLKFWKVSCIAFLIIFPPLFFLFFPFLEFLLIAYESSWIDSLVLSSFPCCPLLCFWIHFIF